MHGVEIFESETEGSGCFIVEPSDVWQRHERHMQIQSRSTRPEELE